MKILDMIVDCPFEKCEAKLKLHYQTTESDKFRKLYNELKYLQITSELPKDFYIFIKAYKETDDEDIEIKNFDENDPSLYYDVSGYESGSDVIYSIAASSYNDFIQYSPDEKTLEKFSPETILAHCLWEITYYGYEDNAKK
ncbi:MAG: hypothetical protein Q4F95_08240 [Oscillospiraceae bacterium]|nr:hypothetical protein [Oscillospiraceae bacterium]